MCHRLDFFRLNSLYYGGIGHYFSNVLTIFTVYIVVYLMAALAVGLSLSELVQETLLPW